MNTEPGNRASAPHTTASDTTASDTTASDTTAYPPAPWRLRGDMYGAVLRLPRGSVPAELVPEHTWIERRDGSVLAVVAWVDYRSGSVLTYRELMVVAVTGLTFPLAGTVLRIWVDAKASLEGGRRLWHIPKDLAAFSFDHTDGFRGAMSLGDHEQASYRFVPRRSVPGRWPARIAVQQDTGTGRRRTISSMAGRVQIGRGHLGVPDDGELAFLNRGSPIAHMALRDFRALFGRSSVDIPPDDRLRHPC